MANSINFKKGTKGNLSILNQGEPGYCTDTDEAFIGDGAVNHPLNVHFIQHRVLDKDTSHALETGVGGDFRLPHSMEILEVGMYCDTAPGGAGTQVDINEGGVSILSTKITLDGSEKSSKTAATPPVISDGSIAEDAIITFDIDAIGSAAAGSGDLVSCHGSSIFVHDGGSSTVDQTLTVSDTELEGLAFDGTNLWGAGNGSDIIYGYSGVSATVITSFSSPDSVPSGLTFDGTNLWYADRGVDVIYKMTGKTETVDSTFAAQSTWPSALTWVGGNLWEGDRDANMIYQHTGATSAITTSFAAPGTNITGLAYDGGDLWSIDVSDAKIFKHSGLTGTITLSFASPVEYCSGLTWRTVPGEGKGLVVWMKAVL